MPHLDRIFVALDNSDRAPRVVAAAADLAETSNAKLILFRAISVPPDLPRTVLALTDARLEDLLLQNARTDLERLAALIPPSRIEKLHAVFGTAWDAICREARETGSDLIVIGSHGYSRFERVLGTTAAKVVNHADRNVLIVRNDL